jgi:Ca-activated chloride channel family protein
VVKDEQSLIVPNVRILQLSTGQLYRTSEQGTFSILSSTAVDSFQFYLDGFQALTAKWEPEQYVQVTMQRAVDGRPKYTLSSLTMGWNRLESRGWLTGNETYADLLENRLVKADLFPNTSFSLNVDRASYSNLRRFIRQRTRVPVDAIRIDEMLNYFNLGHQPPDSGRVFQLNTRLTDCPWTPNNRLFFIQANARVLDLDTLPPAHFTFLIDVSASMDTPNRLPLLQSAFRRLIDHLRDKDSVAIVTYGGITDILLNTISGREKDTIRKVIDSLVAGGATPGESGIKLAYSVARRHFIPGGNNRVILATDGDFNVGAKTEEELEEMIGRESERGIYLTCLGVGMGNYKDSKIQSLAKRGNGNFAYLDGFQEAEKVLFQEFAQTLYSVADGATFSVRFNPNRVEGYRLIGFDNKMGALRDTTARLLGGEVGTGQAAWAMFELTMRPDEKMEESVAQLRIDYRLPNDSTRLRQEEFVKPVWESLSMTDTTYRFATALVWFGSLLRQSAFVPEKTWEELLRFLPGSFSKQDPYQREFEQLVLAADAIYFPKRKKGRK